MGGLQFQKVFLVQQAHSLKSSPFLCSRILNLLSSWTKRRNLNRYLQLHSILRKHEVCLEDFTLDILACKSGNACGLADFFLTLDPCKGVVKNNIGITGAPGDAIAGFFAGAFGVAINCWTDVSRSVLQKKAVADTFNPEIPKPSALGNLNPLPFFRQAGEIYGAKGIMGLYSGVGPKMVHLGGGGAIISALLPPLTKMWYDKQGIERA